MGHQIVDVVEIIHTLSTECSCFDIDENPTTECFGCYQDVLDNFKSEILNPWLERQGLEDDSIVNVTIQGMGWARRSGEFVITAGEIINALTLNGDYRLDFKLEVESDKLSCVRYSHDEPTGASFKFRR